jgi:predicted adenylyl cyclase CyaB
LWTKIVGRRRRKFRGNTPLLAAGIAKFRQFFYFDSEIDIRIQKNNYFSKIWMKKGKIHEECREEIEVKSDKSNFNKLGEIFKNLGHNVKIKWFRKRHTFNWDGIIVTIDYTKGYGYIIELEKMADESTKEITLKLLKEKLKSLNIELTPKEEFNKKYEFYKDNWKDLVKE